MRRRKFRIRRLLALAVALGTLSFVSSASAMPIIDNGGGGNTVGLGPSASAQASFPTPQGLKADGLRLQGNRAGLPEPVPTVPDVLERYAAVHPYGAGLTPAIVPSQSSGFDWGDYAIGSAAGWASSFSWPRASPGSQQRRRMQPA